MAQINLLKQNTSSGISEAGKNIPKLLIRLFSLVLVGLISYYVWLFLQSKSLDIKISETSTKINSEQQSGLSEKNRPELLVRQQQLKALNGIVSSHIYWSQLFKPLADSTLKVASYSSLRAELTGNLIMNVTVPSLADLDKFTQVFNLPDYNKYFSDVTIANFTELQNKDSSKTIQFQVKMKFDPSIIQYKEPKTNAS